MENKSDRDPLEELFRKQLDISSDLPAEDGWDTPSEKVWEGISGNIAPPARFDRRILGAFLLLFLLAGLFFWQNLRLRERIEQQSAALESLEQRLTELAPAFPETGKKKTAGYDLAALENKMDKEQENKKDRRVAEKINKHSVSANSPSKHSAINKQEKTVQISRAKNNATPISGLSEPASGKAVPNAVMIPADAPENLNADLPDLPEKWAPLNPLFKNIELLKQPAVSHEKLNLIQPIARIQPVSSKVEFRIGPYFGAGLTGSRIRYTTGSGNLPFFRDWEKADLSNEWGMSLALDLGRRWSVYSGFGKYGIQQVSRQVFLIHYDPAREIATSGGELRSDYQLKAQSSLGESEVEVELRRQNGQPVPPNSTVRVAVGLRQKLDYSSIPLMVGYRRQVGQFELIFKAGSSINFIGRQSLSATAKSQLQGVRTNSARVLRTFKTDRQTVFDLQVGAGLAYSPGKNWQILLGPNYRSNLIPVNRSEDFNTKTYAWSLQLGMNFRLTN